MNFKLFACVLITAFLGAQVSADLVNPTIPDWRGEAGTAYYGWDSFTDSFNSPNFNDSGIPFGAMLFNFAPGAMITSTGNIYGQTDPLDLHFYGYGPIEQAVLNIASGGTEMDYESVSLYVSDGESGQMFSFDSFATNSYVEIPGFGANVTTLYSWDLSSYEGVITEWAFFVSGTGPHNVLDAASIDIMFAAVPAPGALCLLGFAGMTHRRRR